MLIDKENIQRFIPQRAPFVMVDQLIAASEEDGFKTSFRIEEDNIFLKDGVVSESSLLENIAQTCAAGFGYMNSLMGEGEGKLGFIGAISKTEVHGQAKLNDQLETSVTILSAFGPVHLVKGEVLCEGKSLIECQMKIVQT